MSTLTLVHVVFKGNRMDGWTAVLVITALTSLSCFFFPFHELLPSHVLGVLSLIMLAIAVPARYVCHLAGGWRRIYVITAVLALYFNFFVLIAQLFQKVPPLKAPAPTQSEPPFLVVQTCALVLFIVLGIYSVKGFRSEQLQHAA